MNSFYYCVQRTFPPSLFLFIRLKRCTRIAVYPSKSTSTYSRPTSQFFAMPSLQSRLFFPALLLAVQLTPKAAGLSCRNLPGDPNFPSPAVWDTSMPALAVAWSPSFLLQSSATNCRQASVVKTCGRAQYSELAFQAQWIMWVFCV